ncbi:MAG: helix-turn-helix domain-containing protein [Bryobacteraceae bacterium]
MAAAALEIIREPGRAAALLQPARITILDLCREPNSASGIGREIGLPRQQVNYHMRELEREGYLEFVEERRKGNCIERLVRATAQRYLVSPEALGRLGDSPENRRDRFSAAWLVATAGRAIRELAILSSRARTAGKRIATLTLETEIRFRSPAERNTFAEELAAKMAELATKYHDATAPGGRQFRCFTGVYPAITRTEEAEGKARLD